MTGDAFRLGGFKGLPFSFRPWDGKLRQPMLIAGPRVLVSVSPQAQFLHQGSPLDFAGTRCLRDEVQASMSSRALLVVATLAAMAASAGASAETIFVSNEQDDTVSVIDGATLKVSATIPVGRRPRGIEASGDGKQIYVAAGDDDRIDVIDAASRKVVDHLPSGPDPERFALSPDSAPPLYCQRERQRRFGDGHRRPEGRRGNPGGHRARRHGGVAADGRARRLHVGNHQHGPLHRLAKAANCSTMCWSIPAARRAFSPDGKLVWVSSELRGTVTVLDAASSDRGPVIEFAVRGVPQELIQAVGVAITRDGGAPSSRWDRRRASQRSTRTV